MHQYSMYYLLAINALSFILFGLDKYKAKKGKWRISETTLLTMAAIGGSIGAWAGMRLWGGYLGDRCLPFFVHVLHKSLAPDWQKRGK